MDKHPELNDPSTVLEIKKWKSVASLPDFYNYRYRTVLIISDTMSEDIKSLITKTMLQGLKIISTVGTSLTLEQLTKEFCFPKK